MPATIDLQQDLPVVDRLDETMPCFRASQLAGVPDQSLVDAVRLVRAWTPVFSA